MKKAILLAVALLAVSGTAEARWKIGRRAGKCAPAVRQQTCATPQFQRTAPVQIQSSPPCNGTSCPAPLNAAPVTNEDGTERNLTYPVAYQATVQTPSPAADTHGFLGWLNGIRSKYGLSLVSYDSNLEAWGQVNNSHQHAYGMGHHVMGAARRQNSGMGAGPTVFQMWMGSPAHRDALLDPSISRIGIAQSGVYWTMNAN